MGFMESFKNGYNKGKLQSIQNDANKRCGKCDHYVSGTKMCKKHNKKIGRAWGADGEYCVNWTDFKQQIKKNLR